MRGQSARRITCALMTLLYFQCSVHACGFEDPASIALGSLNFAYPNALYVGTAVWQARQAGILPTFSPRNEMDPIRVGQAALWEAMLTLDQLRRRLPPNMPSVALVFTPAVMWSRLIPGADRIVLKTHVAGPEPSDIVLITEPAVMQAWLNGKITTDQLFKYELIRLYGPDEDLATLRSALENLAPEKDFHPSSLD